MSVIGDLDTLAQDLQDAVELLDRVRHELVKSMTKGREETSRTPGPATAKLLETWKATRAEHKRVGIPDEIIRVTPEVVDAFIAEHVPARPA